MGTGADAASEVYREEEDAVPEDGFPPGSTDDVTTRGDAESVCFDEELEADTESGGRLGRRVSFLNSSSVPNSLTCSATRARCILNCSAISSSFSLFHNSQIKQISLERDLGIRIVPLFLHFISLSLHLYLLSFLLELLNLFIQEATYLFKE